MTVPASHANQPLTNSLKQRVHWKTKEIIGQSSKRKQHTIPGNGHQIIKGSMKKTIHYLSMNVGVTSRPIVLSIRLEHFQQSALVLSSYISVHIQLYTSCVYVKADIHNNMVHDALE